jgi:UPF0176 protein
MLNVLFYLYVEMTDLEGFREAHHKVLEKHNLLGKVLIASEGINGNVTGEEQDCIAYMQELHQDPRFKDMQFKLGTTETHNFRKRIVRIRNEIVTYKIEADMKDKAPYIEPQELKAELDAGEEVVLIDVRNRFEYKIGHFEGAVEAQMDVSSEWPEAVKELASKGLKDKKVVTYCTGGVRCEKATAYLKEQGFTKVRQLHGGIIRYGEEIGDEHWKGKCFVFDTRGAIAIDPEKQAEPITQCETCYLPADTYRNCSLVTCDHRHIHCDECSIRLGGCCSKQCKNHYERSSSCGAVVSR